MKLAKEPQKETKSLVEENCLGKTNWDLNNFLSEIIWWKLGVGHPQLKPRITTWKSHHLLKTDHLSKENFR